MYNQTYSERQIFVGLLKQTAQYKFIHKSEKNPEQVIDKLATRLQNRSEQMQYNKNKSAQFCLHEMKKSRDHVKAESNQLHPLQQIQVDESVQSSTSYFRSFCGPKYSTSYTYLKSSKYLYIFNRAFLPVGHESIITFILTQGQIEYVISYIQLCIKLKKLVRCILPKSLWIKVKDVLEIVWGKYVFQLYTSEMLLLFNQQKAGTFDFEDSVLIFNRNLWCWDSFTAHIIIKGVNYMIKGPGISDQEKIYAAWRKDVIDEPEYCRLIDGTLKASVVWSNASNSDYMIKQQCVHYSISTIENYANFVRCELFNQLDECTIQQIYLCGQIVEYIQGQIVYKSNTILDKFFVVLDGCMEIIQESASQSQGVLLQTSSYFTLQSLTQQIEFSRKTLRISSDKAVIFSIPLWKFKYLLGHELQILRDIQQYDGQVLQDWKDKRLSQWMQKVIKYVSSKSRNLSENSTKLLGTSKLKISNRLWKQICNQDLSILYQTHEEVGEM